MAKKKATRKPKPRPTVACADCSEEIEIPARCRHGRKLVNCRGTDCINAHVTDHQAECTVRAERAKAVDAATRILEERRLERTRRVVATTHLMAELQCHDEDGDRYNAVGDYTKLEFLTRLEHNLFSLEELEFWEDVFKTINTDREASKQ